MSAHGPRHEEILRDIVAGDLAENAPAAQEVLHVCSECRERLGELREVARTLDAAAAAERSARAAADSLPPGAAPGEERVGEILRAAAAGGAGPPSGTATPPRPLVPRLAAAVLVVAGIAALVAIAIGTFSDREPPPGPGPILDGATVEPTAPRGVVDSFDLFEWTAELPPLGWSVVTVHRAGAPPGAPPLARSPEIEETRWRPAPDVAHAWPREIEWEVHVYDAEGTLRGVSERMVATLRRP